MSPAAPPADAVLKVACDNARDAINAAADGVARNIPLAAMSSLFDRERLAIECVSATKARTFRGLTEKAALLDHCLKVLDAAEPSAEIVSVGFSLTIDALKLVEAIVNARR